MTGPVHTVASLRALLDERFPRPSSFALPFSRATADRSPSLRPAALATGARLLDERTGGLPRGALTELVCAAPSCGGQLFFGQLLQASRARAGRVALIDGADEFDPASWPAELLEHLIWVRCGSPRGRESRGEGPEPERLALGPGLSALDSMACADLFARDANLELVAVDLRRATNAELRSIAATSWYRLQRAVEQTDIVLIVLTPFALVPSAQLRLVLDRPHELSAQERDRAALAVGLEPAVARQRATVNQ